MLKLIYMYMIAHFFDFDIIVDVENKPWIIDKNNPNIPIMKLSKSDFNLIKSGIYKNQGNKIVFGDSIFWLPTKILNEIKIKSKNYNVNLSNLAISMQEFLNPNLIENIKYKINLDNISHLKNKTDDIYIICSKNSGKIYKSIFLKLKDELSDLGLNIKNIYTLSETFYNRNSDRINLDKSKILLQHLTGFKTSSDKFIDKEIKSYDVVNFYDDDHQSIKNAEEINIILNKLLVSSEDTILDKINLNNKVVIINIVTNNKLNKFSKKEIKLRKDNVIKTFESFNRNDCKPLKSH